MNKGWSLIVRYIKFSLSTLAGTGVDTLVLWLCSHYLLKGSYLGEIVISPFVSFECAVLTNFTIAYFIVWKDRIAIRSWDSFWRHYAGYNLSCTGIFLLKMGVLMLIEYFSQWDVVVCNLLALCVSGIFNFALNNWVVFRNKKCCEEEREEVDE